MEEGEHKSVTTDALLASLEGVRATRRGWSAKCPAHADRHPSLAIAEGERGLLLKCWAGCTVENICRTLGLRVADLFYERDTTSWAWLEAKRRRDQERADRADIQYVVGLSIDRQREADRLVQSAQGLDISGWDADELDKAIDVLADAHDRLFEEVQNDASAAAI